MEFPNENLGQCVGFYHEVVSKRTAGGGSSGVRVCVCVVAAVSSCANQRVCSIISSSSGVASRSSCPLFFSAVRYVPLRTEEAAQNEAGLVAACRRLGGSPSEPALGVRKADRE